MPARNDARPQWLRLPYVGLVVLGGATGTALRIGAGRLLGPQPFPWSTLIVNLVGAFVLGLITAVAARRQGSGRWKALLGTGLCGGLTTYSTLALDTVRLGATPVALGYLCLSLAGGIGLAFAGLRLGGARPA